MRPDLAFMHPAHRDRKQPARLLVQRSGLRQRRGSEINVGMVVVVEVLRALGHGQQVQVNPGKTSPIQTPAFAVIASRGVTTLLASIP